MKRSGTECRGALRTQKNIAKFLRTHTSCSKFSITFSSTVLYQTDPRPMLDEQTHYPANIYLLNNGNTRNKCEICSKLIIKMPEGRHSGVFIVGFEHTSFSRVCIANLNK